MTLFPDLLTKRIMTPNKSPLFGGDGGNGGKKEDTGRPYSPEDDEVHAFFRRKEQKSKFERRVDRGVPNEPEKRQKRRDLQG